LARQKKIQLILMATPKISTNVSRTTCNHHIKQIPPIPKKTKMRSFDEKHLEDRMLAFEKFINKLLMIPEICSDQILEEFLSVTNAQELNLVKQRY